MSDKKPVDPREWVKSGNYLPPIMRDFHDQKDIFKTIHETVAVEKHEYAGGVSWMVGQCYVIDIFLWWMAKHGYTLQRSRQPVDFHDIGQDVAASRRRSMAALSGLFPSIDQ